VSVFELSKQSPQRGSGGIDRVLEFPSGETPFGERLEDRYADGRRSQICHDVV
jgi:hypothetical protein